MILFNGSTGGLGVYLEPTLKALNQEYAILRARLHDTEALRNELDVIQPRLHQGEMLTHIQLAARVSVMECERNPTETRQTNVGDTVETVSCIMKWAQECGVLARTLYISTGHIYDKTISGQKINESHSINPRSVYAQTKWEAEKALQARLQEMKCPYLIARVFGLLSPRQRIPYVLPSLIQRVVKSEFSSIPGLDNVRDYLDARDVCRHFATLCKVDWLQPADIVNVCSGEATSIRELLLEIMSVMGMDVETIQRQITPGQARPDDLPWIVGDPTRLVKWTHQNPRTISIRQTVREAYQCIQNQSPLTA